jgi:hypothetical protein
MCVHETSRPMHLTERDRWLSECSCGWEQVTRTEIEAQLAWKNHKSAMDEQEEKARLTLSNDRLRNEARDPDVASIEEAFLYIAPVHESVVRDARAALRRIVEEIDKWHREALDWQQAKSEADSDYEECATQRDIAREQVGVLETRLAQIRPLTEAEWAVLMREHDVLHEARRLSNTPGAINTTRDLDRALKRYDEAVAVRDASTPAKRPT